MQVLVNSTMAYGTVGFTAVASDIEGRFNGYGNDY